METTPRQTQENAALAKAARARAMVYHALAEALPGPVPGVDRLLLDAVTVGAQVLGSAACQRAALALAEFPVARSRVNANPEGQPIVLYESLHRQGGLAGQITWDVERHYRALGLAPVGGELPDHASVELAFLGHLAAAEAEARAVGDTRLVARLRVEQRIFLRNHPGAWLPDVGVSMAACGDSFCATVGRLLSGFLSEALIARKVSGQTRTHLPILKDPAACTLCGLCVSSCLLGALRVIESATETALTLNPVGCIGCNRCVSTCPEGVLLLSPGAANGTGCRVMRESPRVGCPGCGRPTVSQAELDAVFTRLQADSAMQKRLCLCVECKSWSQ